MKLRYFAWVREHIGKSEENIELPHGIDTIADLMTWLAERGDGYAAAFAEPQIIRAAIDQEHTEHSAPVRDAGEIAFFPPMTGG